MLFCVGSLDSGLLWLMLLIQWLSIMLMLASEESAVFLNQVLLSSIEMRWVAVLSNGTKQNYSSISIYFILLF